jgi:rod shape-determining protein MreC
MVAIPSRHRSLWLLAAVLSAQVLLLAVREQQGRLVRSWTVALVSPFERAGAWGAGKVRGAWTNYVALRGARRETDELRRELDSLKLRAQQLESKAAEADRLASLLNFRQSHGDLPLATARVIGASADPASQTIYIDRGERDGVRKYMGIITPDGVVGKVIDVFRDTSQVLLVTDKEGGTHGIMADSRIQSWVGGTGEPLLSMKYVSNDDQVAVGERVLTSGLDRVFPKDVPIGTIVDVKPGNPFKQIRLKPAAYLNRLEEVLVIMTLRPLEPKTTEPAAANPLPKSAPTAKPQ